MLYSTYSRFLRAQRKWAIEQAEKWDCHYTWVVVTTSGIRQTVVADCNGYSRGSTCIVTGINRRGQTLSVEAQTEYDALRAFIVAEGQNLQGHVDITTYNDRWNCCFNDDDACHKVLGRSLKELPKIDYPNHIRIDGNSY